MFSHFVRRTRHCSAWVPATTPSSAPSATTTTLSGTKASGYQSRLKSDSIKAADRHGFYPAYVHHVSKIVLQHLQGPQGDWIMAHGLDSGLTINPNGTFELTFPSIQGEKAGRIWTSYDASSKRHWLSVYRHDLAFRFLLKDHGESMNRAIHDSQQMEQEICAAVDLMVSTISRTNVA